jgi:hypothetical protein
MSRAGELPPIFGNFIFFGRYLTEIFKKSPNPLPIFSILGHPKCVMNKPVDRPIRVVISAILDSSLYAKPKIEFLLLKLYIDKQKSNP